MLIPRKGTMLVRRHRPQSTTEMINITTSIVMHMHPASPTDLKVGLGNVYIDISKGPAAILSERIDNNDFKNRLCCLICKKDLLYINFFDFLRGLEKFGANTGILILILLYKCGIFNCFYPNKYVYMSLVILLDNK